MKFLLFAGLLLLAVSVMVSGSGLRKCYGWKVGVNCPYPPQHQCYTNYDCIDQYKSTCCIVVFSLTLALLVALCLAQTADQGRFGGFGPGYGLGPAGYSDFGRYGRLGGLGLDGRFRGYAGGFAGPLGGYSSSGRSYNNYWNGYDGRYGGTATYPESYGSYGGNGFGGFY
ncbi:eggshell protein-like [Pollicipes pollicipes]|uniref:eggshell protein-like n=1 Tax=Pollicipes pollicipes TaxID=41117 RepID=UPI001885A2D8|nr:eggshell protein-like [Pollicipes pollicipes]